MAITTAALIVMGATAAAGAYKAHKESQGADKQAASNDKALELQREQIAKGEAWYKAAWDDWNQKRDQLMKRYNLDITPPGGMPGEAPPGGPPGSPRGVPRGGPGSAPEAVMNAKGINPGQNLGELGGWNDWKRQGLASPQGGGTA